MADAEDLPKRKADIVLGEDLDRLSVADLDRRIEELKLEIARVETTKQKKQAFLSAADNFFKKS